MNIQTPRVKIVITIDRGCGSASWINISTTPLSDRENISIFRGGIKNLAGQSINVLNCPKDIIEHYWNVILATLYQRIILRNEHRKFRIIIITLMFLQLIVQFLCSFKKVIKHLGHNYLNVIVRIPILCTNSSYQLHTKYRNTKYFTVIIPFC